MSYLAFFLLHEEDTSARCFQGPRPETFRMTNGGHLCLAQNMSSGVSLALEIHTKELLHLSLPNHLVEPISNSRMSAEQALLMMPPQFFFLPRFHDCLQVLAPGWILIKLQFP